jgi:hypothetical protein
MLRRKTPLGCGAIAVLLGILVFASTQTSSASDEDSSNVNDSKDSKDTKGIKDVKDPKHSDYSPPFGLQSYEPSAFGKTKNNDDVGFLNIDISVKFPLAPGILHDLGVDDNRFYFSFTGRWGFYIGTRYSGPVVGKEYNPQLFWQHLVSCGDKFTWTRSYGEVPASQTPSGSGPCYFMFGYNHDSNGQIIDSPGQYAETVRSQGAEAALDAISRGWDFIRFTAKYIPASSDRYELSLYPELKYFLADGLLQGKQEELHYWENPPDGKPRKEVDGLGFLVKYKRRLGYGVIGDGKLAVAYDTGYQDPFRFNTVRLEAGIQILQLPIVFWAEKGYMSDLSQYYRNVTGYGLQIEIGSF